MPKQRKIITLRDRIVPRRKHRIGNRKSGQAAGSMPTDKLQAVAAEGGRYAHVARAELVRRATI